MKFTWIFLGIVLVLAVILTFHLASPPSPVLKLDSDASYSFSDLKPDLNKSDAKSFTISNAGGGTLSGTIAGDMNWLHVDPGSFEVTNGKQNISFWVDTKDMDYEPSYTGTIQINTNGGNNSVKVNLSLKSELKPVVTQYKVFFDRRGDLQSLKLDGTQYTDNSYKPDRSPDGNTIVFEKETDFGNKWLYLKDADGTNTRPLIPMRGGGPSYESPAWSPDGSKIAFSKYRTGFQSTTNCDPGSWDIWIMNVDGSDMRQVTSSQGGSAYSGFSPAWFPDSKRIAFANNEGSYWQICYTSIDSPEFNQIVSLPSDYVPGNYKISPDGKRLIYEYGPGTDLKILAIDISSKKIIEWPNIDTSEISAVESQDGIVSIITKPDGLYYTDNSHKEPYRIPNTETGDIAIKIE